MPQLFHQSDRALRPGGLVRKVTGVHAAPQGGVVYACHQFTRLGAEAGSKSTQLPLRQVPSARSTGSAWRSRRMFTARLSAGDVGAWTATSTPAGRTGRSSFGT